MRSVVRSDSTTRPTNRFVENRCCRCCFHVCLAIDEVLAATVQLVDHSGLDDDLECLRIGRVAKGLVGVQDLIEFEAMRDETLGIDLV